MRKEDMAANVGNPVERRKLDCRATLRLFFKRSEGAAMLKALLDAFHWRDIKKRVERHGWTIVPVDGPLSWAYSVGFPQSVGAPEVICFAPALGAARIVSDIRNELAERRLALQEGLVWAGLGFPVCARKVHESQVMGFQWMRLAKAHAEAEAGCRVDIEAYQLFLADALGLYPWEDGCHPNIRDMQPLLFMPLDPENHPPRARPGAAPHPP